MKVRSTHAHSHATLAGILNAEPREAVALRFGNQQLSYGALCAAVDTVARGLAARGLEAGDVLGIWLPNTPRWLLLHLACASLGVATLSLNPKLGVKELVSFIDRSACKALAFDVRLAHVQASQNGAHADAAAALEDESLLGQVWRQHAGSLNLLIDCSDDVARMAWGEQTDRAQRRPAWCDWEQLQSDRSDALTVRHEVAELPCIILSSSGTTSVPKLIVHTQRNVALHVQDVAPGFDVDAACTTLLVLPMCGAFGYTAALMTLAAGATLLLHDVFDPVKAVQALSGQPVSHMFGTNDMVGKMLANLRDDWQPRALRMFGHANFVPGLDELPAQAERFGIRMVGCFGMSEIFALFAHQRVNAPLPRRGQSGGVPVTASVQVRARDLATGNIAAPMEAGELEFKGPYMMREYFGDPQATARVFTEDGFLRSGDLGYVNGDGGFTHVSRLGDVLRIGGFLVNPAEIEEALLAICPSSACQVVAVNAQGSSRPFAFVIDHPDLAFDEDAIKNALQHQIARYKVPIRILKVDSFPYVVGPNGSKVKRNELRDMAQAIVDKENAK